MVTGQDKDEERDEQQVRPPSGSNERTAIVDEDDASKQQEKLIGNGVTRNNNKSNGTSNPEDWKLTTLDTPNFRHPHNRQDLRGDEDASSNEKWAETRSIIRRRGAIARYSETEDEETTNARHDDSYGKNENLQLETEEEEDYETETELANPDGWIKKKVVTTRQNFGEQEQCNGHAVQQTMPHLDETSFGEVNIVNSEHVHVGNTNFYKGPVTIKQFVYTNAHPIETDANDSIDNNIKDPRNGRSSDINRKEGLRAKSDHLIPPAHDDYEKVKRWLWTWRCAVILCALALSSVTIVVVVSVLLSSKIPVGTSVVLPDTPTSGTSGEDVWVDSVRFIERSEWLAQPPTEPLRNLSTVPAPYIIISHTASEPCKLQSECVLRVRLIQTFHIESKGWSDIGYNFLVGGDGLAYVGRGWDAEGAHAFGWNKKSIGISVIGTFNDVPPYKTQLHAILKVIDVGVKLGKISPDYKILGHRQVSKTLSPGDVLYAIIQTWDHWSPIPQPSLSSRAAIHPQPNNYLVFFTSIVFTACLKYSRLIVRH